MSQEQKKMAAAVAIKLNIAVDAAIESDGQVKKLKPYDACTGEGEWDWLQAFFNASGKHNP
jgi:hypothetical protein